MKRLILTGDNARQAAIKAIYAAPEGWEVVVKPATRNGDQNARFHAMVGDIARSGIEWAGKRRSADQWKVLLVSAHAVATKEGGEIIPGLEGEFVNIRESTALMSKGRAASLIDYVSAFGDSRGVVWSEPI
jgi:hypothetical protein